MGYNHRSGRNNEREIVDHLRRNGFAAADMATEKGIGQITPEDVLAWSPGHLPDLFWHRGREYWGDHTFEVQAKWSKSCTGFKSAYNRHRRDGVPVGCCPSNHHQQWQYGPNACVLWANAGICTGGLNAWAYVCTHNQLPRTTEVDNVLTSKIQKWVNRPDKPTEPDAVIMRGPKQPLLVAWKAP